MKHFCNNLQVFVWQHGTLLKFKGKVEKPYLDKAGLAIKFRPPIGDRTHSLPHLYIVMGQFGRILLHVVRVSPVAEASMHLCEKMWPNINLS